MSDSISMVINEDIVQLCGFKVRGGQYAISVLDVQEVIKPQPLTPVPLSPDFVTGLINLRGQIVTSINLRKLFQIEDRESEEHMNIIVRSGDSLYALMVDEILDVIDVEQSTFETIPETINENIRKYISGVYKLEETLLILLDLKKIFSIDIKG
ncbi:chemotaxis protein CheW [Bacteriovorax sp. Seq25_V]|uniref:chemotaxis protein CheW n=1 Tax=Bacteriovorax sp. Seq25_V TaxID=1201288 RepID=UPI000389ED84|nr:chemotaxis protein CheW [Bacteriovorax sp. Seq25_V]EQC47482.1 CheW-like protein [Bacteriovorax sp. Seq25_V]